MMSPGSRASHAGLAHCRLSQLGSPAIPCHSPPIPHRTTAHPHAHSTPMKLLTTPHTHSADESSSTVKPYNTHTITTKLSFTPTSSAAISGGFMKRRQSHGGETTSDELANDMEYIFEGKLTVEEVSPPQKSQGRGGGESRMKAREERQ